MLGTSRPVSRVVVPRGGTAGADREGPAVRAIWNGAVSFGLVNVPVRLYAATSNHDIRFHQVHERDGGRIRQKRTCSVCGEEVEYAEIAKGYETDDGQLIMLDDDDLATLPTATGHEIDVVEFVPSDQIDALLLDKSYYLEPENKAVKPYALLREALRETDRMAVVKVALRQRETLALLRVRGDAIVLQTMLWPDEVREADFPTLEQDIELRPQELQMASSLVESLAADFDPDQFSDDYRRAVVDLLEHKREHGGGRPTPEPAPAEGADDMTDLLTALRRSVEAAGGRAPAEEPAEVEAAPAPTAAPTKPAAKKPAAAKATTPKATTPKAAGEKAPAATAKKAPARKKATETDEKPAARRSKSA